MTRPHLLLPLPLLLLAACAPTVVPVRNEPIYEASYDPMAVRTAAPGEPMHAAVIRIDAPVYEVTQDYTPPQSDAFRGGLDYPPLTKGMRFTKVADRSDGLVGLADPGYGVSRPQTFAGRETFLPITIWITPEGVVSETMEGRAWTRDRLFAQLPHDSTAMRRVVFDYAGMDGGTVRLLVNDSWYPSASPKELRIPMGTDRRARYAGLVIDVLKADPQMLTYRLYRDAAPEMGK